MKLDLTDTLALLERLLEKEPETSKPGGFTVRLRRLHDLVEETQCAEPTLAAISGFVFPGVSSNSLRATLGEFRKSMSEAATAAGLSIELIRPDARKVDIAEIICHFEGIPLPIPYDTSGEEAVLSRENEVVEPRARATRIFVSFAVADQKLSKEFTDQLKANLPLRFAEPVYLWRFDEKGGILPGEDNEEIIRQKMEESQFGILLVSPTYLSRPFINRVELPHFLGENARAHPIPIALADFNPGQDKHGLLDPKNVYTYQGKSYYQTEKKRRGDFIKALCDQISDTITKYPKASFISNNPSASSGSEEFKALNPEMRTEDGEYIPNHGRPERTLGKSAATKFSDGNEASVPVLDTLYKWAKDPNESAYMAILGEAGAGKTMTCSKFAQTLNAKKPGSCIYIDLRTLNESGLLKTQANPTLDQILEAILGRNPSNKRVTPERVLQAVREQGSVLIWDGLDEVLVHLSSDEGDAFFRQLKEALPPQAIGKTKTTLGRLVFACRTQYFRSFEHEASSLTQAQRGPVHADAPMNLRARFNVLRILPFNDDQIRAYITANIPGLDLDRALEVIRKVHNLHDLAQRPYCLSLMRTSLPDLDRTLAAGKKVRSVDLYQSLVRSWLARDSSKHRFDEDDKPRLMGCLAAWMWGEGAKSLTVERLGQWLKETVIGDSTFRALYGDSFKDTKNRDELLQDFRTATFIARWDGDSFRFAHTSLQEYFLATHLVTALEEGNLDEWMLPQMNRETLDFAAELSVQRMEASPAVKRRLEDSLGSLLGESVAGRSENAFAFYLRLHRMEELAWVPVKLDLRNLDLTAWEIMGSGEKRLEFPSADFSDACLIRSRFRYVEMHDSRWQRADLCSAEFISCGLNRADFSLSRMEGGRLRDCQLAGTICEETDGAGLSIELPVWNEETQTKWVASHAQLHRSNTIEGIPEAQWIFGHGNAVNGVALSTDGKRVVSGSSDNMVRIWDGESGKCLRVLKGHDDWVNCVALSADGKRVVSGSRDNMVRVWDEKSGKCLRVLKGHDNLVSSVALSADGKRIVSGSHDKTVRIWAGESGKCLRVLKGHDNWVSSVALTTDGKRVVSGSYDKTVRVWDGESGNCQRVLRGHENAVSSVALSADGKGVVSGSRDNIVRVWNWESDKCLLVLTGHENLVSCVALTTDGKRVVSGSYDKTVRVWDGVSGKCLRVLGGHENWVSSVELTDERLRVVSGSYDKSVRIWDGETGRCLRVLGGYDTWVSSVALSADEMRVVSGSYDKTVRIWNGESGKCLRVLKGHDHWVSSVAITADGMHIVSKSGDKCVRVWDAESGALIETTSSVDLDLLGQNGGRRSTVGGILHQTKAGVELDIIPLPEDGYVVLKKTNGDAPWRIAWAKGEYWRYVNYATDGPEGRVLWSADVLGRVPED